MNAVRAIARYTYLELLRDRLLLGIAFIGALLTALTFFLATVSFDQDARILHSLGLTAVAVAAVGVSVAACTQGMARDAERRVPAFIFTKPVTREQYVLGKYVGFLAAGWTALGLLSALFLLGTAVIARGALPAMLATLGGVGLEVGVVTALAVALGSFAPPLNAALYAAGFTVIGHSLSNIRDFFGTEPASRGLTTALGWLLPNLGKFDLNDSTLLGLYPSAAQVVAMLLYALAWVALLLFLASRAVRAREY